MIAFSAKAQTTYKIPQSQNALPAVLITSTPLTDSLQKIPASVNVILATDLQRGDQTTLSNELIKAPGVFMQQGALNTSRITIRGIGARSSFSTNRVKAYFEGIPLTTGEGETTLEDIDLNLIERIEIIKGPASSSYGSGLGGAIVISAKKPKQDRAFVNGMGGSYGLFKYGGGADLITPATALSLAYNNLSRDGFRDNNGYRRQNLTAYASTVLNVKNSLVFFGNLTRMKAFIPSSLSQDDFNNNPEKAAFTWSQSRGYESYDKALLGLSHTWTPSENWKLNTSLFINHRDGYEPRPFNILDETSTSLGIRSNLKNKFGFFGLKANSSVGMEYFAERYNATTFENLYGDNEGNGSLQGDRLGGVGQDRKYLNLFAQMNLQVTEKLKTEFGLNYNHSRYTLEDTFNTDADERQVYTYPRQFLPHFGMTYEVVDDQYVYAGINRGFSLPSVEETLTPEGSINTDTKPENGWNYEIGLKSQLVKNRLYLELAIYTMQINNLIVSRRIAEDQFIGINAGKTDHTGVELLLNYKKNLTDRWVVNPYASVAINRYRFDEFKENDEDYGDNDLTGVPNNVINGGFTVNKYKGWAFNVNYRYVGSIPLNDGNTLYSDTYQLVNLRIDREFNFSEKINVNFYGGINNLFDTDYASQILPNAVGFGGVAPRYYYPGEPINFYLGASVGLGF